GRTVGFALVGFTLRTKPQAGRGELPGLGPVDGLEIGPIDGIRSESPHGVDRCLAIVIHPCPQFCQQVGVEEVHSDAGPADAAVVPSALSTASGLDVLEESVQALSIAVSCILQVPFQLEEWNDGTRFHVAAALASDRLEDGLDPWTPSVRH